MKLLLAALLLAFSTPSLATVVLSAGVGKNIMKQNGTPFERTGIVGYQFQLPKSVFIQPQAGYFLDTSGDTKSSIFASTLFGVEAKALAGPVLHLGVGPGYLQNPDQILGGHFQFNLEGGIGLCDGNVCVKLIWTHLSSGGIEMPNLGRDFICAQVSILSL